MYLPLMSIPISKPEGLVSLLRPLVFSLLLLYLLPDLFSDNAAQAVWETYHLDTLTANCP